MKKLICFLIVLASTNTVMAYDYGQLSNTNSLSRSALEIMAINNPPVKNLPPASKVNDQTEQTNSFFHAVLAHQQSRQAITSLDNTFLVNTEIKPKQHNNNSLFSGLLEKQASHYQ
jgi:hypothetical protein